MTPFDKLRGGPIDVIDTSVSAAAEGRPMSFRLADWCNVGMLFIAAFALVAAAPPQCDPQQKRVSELIDKLGDDDFAVREDAQKELKRIGKPCADHLARAFGTANDLEIRKRAVKLLNEIDPGCLQREQRKGRRRELAQQIAKVRDGTDATTWGESIANPFTALTEEGKKKLRARGVEVDRLLKMRARLILGSYGGALSLRFVNLDPNTILVFGKGFGTREEVHSVGPVLAVEGAYFGSRVTGADLVWFVDKSSPHGRTCGAPLVLAPDVSPLVMKTVDEDVLRGDFGWKAPKDLGKPLLAPTKFDPPATEELAAAQKKLTALIKKVKGIDVKDHAARVANPFTNLTDEGKKKLKARGIDVDRLARLKKALYLAGNHWLKLDPFVNTDSGTVLVLGSKFKTPNPVYSLGPILAVDDANVMADVTGADLVWFVDKSFPRGTITGVPVILQPSANRGEAVLGSKHVWYGDYGWRRPDGWPALKDLD